MIFPNNTEKYSFLKGDWSLTEISSDGNTIYMGRPSRHDAEKTDPCWFIKRITISQTEEGGQLIKTEVAVGENWKNSWEDRTSLTYKYF